MKHTRNMCDFHSTWQRKGGRIHSHPQVQRNEMWLLQGFWRQISFSIKVSAGDSRSCVPGNKDNSLSTALSSNTSFSKFKTTMTKIRHIENWKHKVCLERNMGWRLYKTSFLLSVGKHKWAYWHSFRMNSFSPDCTLVTLINEQIQKCF